MERVCDGGCVERVSADLVGDEQRPGKEGKDVPENMPRDINDVGKNRETNRVIT
jgi:hypothetical protein